VIELLREFFSDTMNFVHRQVLQISALHILPREVLFAYGAVEKPVGGGYIPSRLIKVLVPDKDEYVILADVFREARANNNRDSSMDDEDLQSRTSEETYHVQRTRMIDRDDKKLFLYQASADDKISAPSNAGSDQKVKMEGLYQRTIGSENNTNQIPIHITEPPPINGREYFFAAADKLSKENSACNASYRSMSSPVASAGDNNTGGRVDMDRAQESEVLTRREPGGSIRHSAQNSDITCEERQAALSRQQVTNITKMFDKKMNFTGEIGNGNAPLDQTISAHRSICQAIVASDEDARRAMFSIFSDAALSYFYENDTERDSVSEVFAGLRGIFYDVATIEKLEIESTEYTWLRVKSDNPNIKDNHALFQCLLTLGRELQKQLSVDGFGADVQLRNFLHRCPRHAPFSAYMPTIKSETSGLYMPDLNLATERLHTAKSSSGKQCPRQMMTLFGDGHENGNSNIYDDALEEDHGDAGYYYRARAGPGYETQYKKNDYSRGNA
jgi:hypothetical protein